MFNLKKILSKKNSTSQAPAAPIQDMDKRRHDRMELSEKLAATIAIASIPPQPLDDLSYGGASVLIPGELPELLRSDDGRFTEKPVPCELRLLGDTYRTAAQIRSIRQTSDGTAVGLSFIHDDPILLLALRNIIEPLRWGGSVTAISKDIAADRYQGKEWHTYRGDGPVDLVIKIDESSNTNEFLLVFRHGQDYLEVQWQNKHLRTSRSKQTNQDTVNYSAAAQMIASPDIDLSTLKIAVALVSGIKSEVCPFQDQLLRILIAKSK